MARAIIVLRKDEDRAEAIRWVTQARLGSRLDFRGPTRSLPQNAKMQAMLTDVVRQGKTIDGRRLTTDEWKCVFMQALGKEQQLLPTLDGEGFFTTGYSSSKLSVEEMSDLIEFMMAWGAENDVVWSDPELASYESMRTR